MAGGDTVISRWINHTPQKEIPRLPPGPLRDGERDLMAHRYLYYVLAEPVLTDSAYSLIESSFLSALDQYSDVFSIMQLVGSDLADSYTDDEIARAIQLLPKRKQKQALRRFT
jgi:hypothetical protein